MEHFFHEPFGRTQEVLWQRLVLIPLQTHWSLSDSCSAASALGLYWLQVESTETLTSPHWLSRGINTELLWWRQGEKNSIPRVTSHFYLSANTNNIINSFRVSQQCWGSNSSTHDKTRLIYVWKVFTEHSVWDKLCQFLVRLHNNTVITEITAKVIYVHNYFVHRLFFLYLKP